MTHTDENAVEMNSPATNTKVTTNYDFEIPEGLED